MDTQVASHIKGMFRALDSMQDPEDKRIQKAQILAYVDGYATGILAHPKYEITGKLITSNMVEPGEIISIPAKKKKIKKVKKAKKEKVEEPEEEVSHKRIFKCKSCGETGHMAKTCPKKKGEPSDEEVEEGHEGGKLSEAQYRDVHEAEGHEMTPLDIAQNLGVRMREVNMALQTSSYQDYLSFRK